ncbi:uncharacterized protein LOC133712445 isoform X5 [Rosa rugosa]|uniref:uncharacterized protein LOC133712445 isoform X5 n=1 Tax=Rosa rugosa TaxID=74645 RepID=UPI002B4020F8|nr:uncharacterized protein LOC133712445 isoform X5 [Rosa rugosa]
MGIFEPFIAIGYTTTSVPFSVQRLGTEAFVTVSVGRAFQIYNLQCAMKALPSSLMWIFDTSDGDARLLQFRSGHSDPPQYMRELVEFLFLN